MCCVFCVGIVCATASIVKSFNDEYGAEELAKVYALQYEDALQKYTGLVPSSVSSDDSVTTKPDVNASVPDNDAIGGTDKEVTEPSADGTTKSNMSDATTEGLIPSTTAKPSVSINPPSSNGGNGSSEGSSSIGELSDKSDAKDEAKDTPESGTLPSYAEYCVKDSNGHWIYIVKRGDSLSRISGKVGFSVQELADYNHIENVNLIYTNQTIRLPCVAGCDCSFCE